MSCYFYQGFLKFTNINLPEVLLICVQTNIVDQASQLYYENRNFTQY